MANRGRPRMNEEEHLRGYRYNLNLDKDLDNFLHIIAWRKHTSITQYINDLIRADMKKHYSKMDEIQKALSHTMLDLFSGNKGKEGK